MDNQQAQEITLAINFHTAQLFKDVTHSSMPIAPTLIYTAFVVGLRAGALLGHSQPNIARNVVEAYRTITDTKEEYILTQLFPHVDLWTPNPIPFPN